MDKVIASYLVKITVRQATDVPKEAPTIQAIEQEIEKAIAVGWQGLVVKASAERTDA